MAASGGNAIRGSRVGAGPVGENERGESAPRRLMTFYCANGHATQAMFAIDAEFPEVWDCTRCGLPAGTESAAPPAAPRTEPYKTHLAYVKERRSEADGNALLEEALNKLKARRGE